MSGDKNKNRMETDYQSKFGSFRSGSRRVPIRPIERPKDPNPPSMDFRTENHESYKFFSDVERLPPCKVRLYNYCIMNVFVKARNETKFLQNSQKNR